MRDNVVEKLIEEELERQQNTIELIASENIVSRNVLAAAGSILTNKYAEGKPNKRYYNNLFYNFSCKFIFTIRNTIIPIGT